MTKAAQRRCRRISKVQTRRSTCIQDKKVMALLREGHSRKHVAARLLLTYWQVTLAVYRYESKSQKKSNL